MGILNKLMFWKKEDEFDFDETAEKELDFPKEEDEFNLDQQPSELDEGFPAEEHPSAPPFSEPQVPGRSRGQRDSLSQPSSAYAHREPVAGTRDRDLELIQSKLDTLKAILTSLDQRMANLERAAGVEKKERLW